MFGTLHRLNEHSGRYSTGGWGKGYRYSTKLRAYFTSLSNMGRLAKNGAKYKLYLIGVLLLKLYAVQDESNNIRIATNAGKL